MFLLGMLGGDGLRWGGPLIFGGTVFCVLCLDVLVLWWYKLKRGNFRVCDYWLASRIGISSIYVKYTQ